MNQKGFANIALIVLVVLLAGAVGYFVLTKEQSPSIKTNDSVLFGDDTAVQDNTPKKSVVKIPLIEIGGSIGFGDKVKWDQGVMNKAKETGELIGCGDKVVYVSKEIQSTTQPLNAVYRELFSTGSSMVYQGKEYANLIADQAKERIITYENRPPDVFKPLRFVKAEIGDNTAKVYLEGGLVSNECNDPRVEAQIIFAAKQFPNITEIKTYLNDKEFNWKAWMNQRG